MSEQPYRFDDTEPEEPAVKRGPTKEERAETWDQAFWFVTYGIASALFVAYWNTGQLGLAVLIPVVLPLMASARRASRERRAVVALRRELSEFGG